MPKSASSWRQDIRCTELNEHGMNRSFSMNQFTRGCAVAAMTGERGVPVSQGGIDVMSWEEIIEHLKEDVKEDSDEGVVLLDQEVPDNILKAVEEMLKADGVYE